jgi:hypothetical protein
MIPTHSSPAWGRLLLGGVRLAINEEFRILVEGFCDIGALQDDLLALVPPSEDEARLRRRDPQLGT